MEELRTDLDKFVVRRVHEAALPIILTAPHGGNPNFGNQANVFLDRPNEVNVVKKGDLWTFDLLKSIDDYIYRNVGKRVHIVALRVHRKYIDANRNNLSTADCAYHPTCKHAAQTYRLYHQCIEDCIQHATQMSLNGRVLLLDIHGLKPYADFITVGSCNKVSACFDGDNSMERPYIGFLAHLRNLFSTSVQPLPYMPDIVRYRGGYSTQRHGDGSVGRVDGLQLEFGSFLRLREVREDVAEFVAEAIIRTLNPMQFFIDQVATYTKWNPSQMEAVKFKLRTVNCFKPSDIADKLRAASSYENLGKVLNTQLKFLGFKVFTKRTLRTFCKLLQVDFIQPTTTHTSSSSGVGSTGSTTPSILSEVATTNNIGTICLEKTSSIINYLYESVEMPFSRALLVRRIFFPAHASSSLDGVQIKDAFLIEYLTTNNLSLPEQCEAADFTDTNTSFSLMNENDQKDDTPSLKSINQEVVEGIIDDAPSLSDTPSLVTESLDELDDKLRTGDSAHAGIQMALLENYSMNGHGILQSSTEFVKEKEKGVRTSGIVQGVVLTIENRERFVESFERWKRQLSDTFDSEFLKKMTISIERLRIGRSNKRIATIFSSQTVAADVQYDEGLAYVLHIEQ
jgi:N-formylglutamate amidohydrolase